MIESIKPKGTVEFIIEHKDGHIEHKFYNNQVLLGGRNALASALSNSIQGSFNYFISNIRWGNGGTSGGTVRTVDSTRAGLFGLTVLKKGVISNVNPVVSSQATFTSVVGFDEANGQTINEMGLEMNNGSLFSMVTFADINKTSSIQWTLVWNINFV